jgi:hypothetical protein
VAVKWAVEHVVVLLPGDRLDVIRISVEVRHWLPGSVVQFACISRKCNCKYKIMTTYSSRPRSSRFQGL